MTGLSRPTSVAGMFQRVARYLTPDGIERAMAFVPRPSDVLIATYPKSGTTWLQQLVHTLRTGGDTDFGEITEVVPWLELAHDLGQDPDAPQRAEPRAYKTHLPWEAVPKGGRYIVAVRDPGDVLVSQYHFWDGWLFETASVSLEQIATEFFLNPQMPLRYWAHLRSWWPQRLREDVLMLAYEDMHADLPGTARRVARFMGLAADPALLTLACERASLAYMKAHASQFDDHLVRAVRDPACGIPPGGSADKVRAGQVGAHRQVLSADVQERLAATWRSEIGAVFGLESYAQLRAALAAGAAPQLTGDPE